MIVVYRINVRPNRKMAFLPFWNQVRNTSIGSSKGQLAVKCCPFQVIRKSVEDGLLKTTGLQRFIVSCFLKPSHTRLSFHLYFIHFDCSCFRWFMPRDNPKYRNDCYLKCSARFGCYFTEMKLTKMAMTYKSGNWKFRCVTAFYGKVLN